MEGEGVIKHKAYARVGLLGNPSDVYYGNTISLSLANFSATVTLHPSNDLLIQPHPIHDFVRFTSLPQLVFHNYCKENAITLTEKNFTLSYDTDIPRQTGLSGSSAIVCAALNCLLDFYDVRHLIKVEVRPGLVLAAENELGIVAGLQDRVAQVYGGLVYMDFSKENMDKLGHGVYEPLDMNLLRPLHLIYAENPSDSGKVHSQVRQRWLNGEEFIVSSMKEVANLAKEGRKALEENDKSKLAALMNRNFDLRMSMFGDAALEKSAPKFTGSGEAVVVYCPHGNSHVKLLKEECNQIGFVLQPIELVPSSLNDTDLKIF
ncbi:hypothetical protein AAHE18_01G070700 [Arachis hypogaea]